jgi:alpha-ketoglutarate-dependent taurine dioxygenase
MSVLQHDVSEFSTATAEAGWLDEGQGRILCLRARDRSVNLVEWAAQHAALIDEATRAEGAVLFRGFVVADNESFSRFIAATSSEWADYREPATPRREVSSNIFTSTEYPAEQRIPLHNENSHCTSWPLKIYFYSVVPALSGGQTPIADCRKVLARIPDSLIARFEQRKWRYARHFGSGLGFSWNKVFQTDDRAEVERYCQGNAMEFEWGAHDSFTVRYVRPAVRVHPVTGEAIWFNHGLFFNPISIDPSIREMLLESFTPDELPYTTYYGDGEPIADEDLEIIAQAYREETRSFAWQTHDVLLADNMLVAHGRNAFKGPRKVLVGMADSYSG